MANKSEITFKSNLKAVEDFLVGTAAQRMETVCQLLVDETKIMLSGQRSGRRYIIPGLKTIKDRETALSLKRGKVMRLTAKQLTARKYTASAPGESPAVRTGRLRNSVRYRIVSAGGMDIYGVVGSPLDYAPWLEFGTSDMAPRPFLRPAYERERENIKTILGSKMT